MFKDEEKYNNAEIECIECGEMVPMRLYECADETDKDLILSHMMNRGVCPHCGTEAHMFPRVLYSDLTHHTAIVMDGTEELFQVKKVLEEGNNKESGNSDEEIKDIYYVSKEDDLITAIMCLDNDLDYQVTKLLLYILKKEYINKHPDKTIDYLSLGNHRNEKGELLVSIFDASGQETIYKPFPMDRYQKFFTMYKDKLEKANLVVIDDSSCEFFCDHLEDIAKGNRKTITVYNVLVGDCAMFLATSIIDGVKEGDMVTFIQKAGYEVSGECVCIQDIDTISIGRELSELEVISDYYAEGGNC